MTSIRLATALDSDDIFEVHSQAFPETEAHAVATLAIRLLHEKTVPGTFALVAEMDGHVVGHVAFSPVTLDASRKWNGWILAPLGVRPEYQKRRVGSELVERGMERLSNDGGNLLFVYGDPGYYGRFGFNAETAAGFRPPYELQYPFGWQAVSLGGGGLAGCTGKISCVTSLSDPALW